MSILPNNLERLHCREEQLRSQALGVVADNPRHRLHLVVVECAMDLADLLRQYKTDDEDLKVAQLLGMRTFNAFGASLKLVLSGYSQNGALILRDVLETVFLLDLLQGDRTLIERWRLADKKTYKQYFSPVKVRETLDDRDGFTSKKRAEIYKLFSELAGHPTMKSAWMMRPQKDGDAVVGPFIEPTMLEAVLSEMGRLAIQVGDALSAFMPNDWLLGLPTRQRFLEAKRIWIETFYATTKD